MPQNIIYSSAKKSSSSNVVSRFTTSAQRAMAVIRDHIDKKVPNISMAGWLAGADSAKLGYLMNQAINRSLGENGKWNTLFANSTLESLYAVTRLCRQYAKEAGRPAPRKVVIYDREDQYQYAFDPLKVGSKAALCPEIHFANSDADFVQKFDSDKDFLACVIFVLYPGQMFSAELKSRIDELASSHSILSVIANTEKSLSNSGFSEFPFYTDIIIHGENICDFEVPFATFSMREHVYKVWGTKKTLSSYTSTFAGNSTCISTALAVLLQNKIAEGVELEEVFANIDGSFDVRMEYFAKYVHPVFADLFKADRNELRIIEAEGVVLKLENGSSVLDLSSLGCSLRGHNPQDIIGDVIDSYDAEVDYFDHINEKICRLTHFRHVLPSVSGAGAVDNAITIAMLAQPSRRKILSFVGNYSGKTLTSVNLSKTAPLLADFDLPAFEPYYEDVVCIDPHSPDAHQQFLDEVAKGDVALVWFECVQGYMLKSLPLSIMKLVEETKAQAGYLIGVDEVLTGMWKNGRSMLFHQGLIGNVDIVTMSKATSDMVFPVSWALVNEHVYEQALKTNAVVVENLRFKMRNNLGGMIALNALDKAEAFFNQKILDRDLDEFHAAIFNIIKKTDIFNGITREGSLLKFNLNPVWFPYSGGTIQATLIESTISKLIFYSTGILLTNLRIFLPVIHDSSLYEQILARLMSGIEKVSASTVYAYMLCMNYEILNLLGMKANFVEILVNNTRRSLEMIADHSKGATHRARELEDAV